MLTPPLLFGFANDIELNKPILVFKASIYLKAVCLAMSGNNQHTRMVAGQTFILGRASQLLAPLAPDVKLYVIAAAASGGIKM